MPKQEEILQGLEQSIRLGICAYQHLGFDREEMYHEIALKARKTLISQGVVIKVKCLDCEWSQYGDEESVGMTPCHSCNSTGYIYEPLIKGVKDAQKR